MTKWHCHSRWCHVHASGYNVEYTLSNPIFSCIVWSSMYTTILWQHIRLSRVHASHEGLIEDDFINLCKLFLLNFIYYVKGLLPAWEFLSKVLTVEAWRYVENFGRYLRVGVLIGSCGVIEDVEQPQRIHFLLFFDQIYLVGSGNNAVNNTSTAAPFMLWAECMSNTRHTFTEQPDMSIPRISLYIRRIRRYISTDSLELQCCCSLKDCTIYQGRI